MKSIILLASASVLALLFAFTTPEVKPLENSATSPTLKADFQFNVVNCDLETRFETQFSNRIPDVTRVDVHHNEMHDYYYAVYGVDLDGKAVVDYFKTTKEEVENEKYDYIQLSDRTTNAVRVCREATTFPFPFDFCHLTNNGPICGIEWWPGVCIFY